MLRLIGGGLIAAAGVGMALQYRLQNLRQLTELRQGAELLSLMRSELEARRTPLPELLSLMRKSCAGSAARFSSLLSEKLPEMGERSFSELWNDCVNRAFPHLLPEERRKLCSVGKLLGRCELASQLTALDRCTGELLGAEKRLRDGLALRGRSAAGLFCVGTLLLMIVLW